MKIIFLDIDGVLNSEESIVKYHDEAEAKNEPYQDYTAIFPEEYMNNLKEIVDKTNAKIVVSSTWRLGFPDDSHWLKLMYNLEEYNLDKKVIGVTSNRGRWRCEQIKEWLEANKELGIDNFVILDDDSFDMGEYVDTKLAKTSWKTGLIESVKDRAIEILNEC